MSENFPFTIWLVIGDNGEQVGAGLNLPIAHAAYEKAVHLYPLDLIELRQGARIVAKSKHH